VRLNKKAVASTPQPDTIGKKDLTVNRRTTRRYESSVSWNERGGADEHGHFVRSFLSIWQNECPLMLQARVYTPQSRSVKAYNRNDTRQMIHTWKLSTPPEEVHFPDESSLDAIARQLPDGWYTTFRTFDKGARVIGLSAHLRRLPHADASLLRRSLNHLLDHFRPSEARIRVMETRAGEFYVSIEPLKLLPREVYEQGVKVETTTLQRLDPRIKSTTFISASDKERRHIAIGGIFEALLVKNGRILEGMTSNFFYLIDGVLHTARCDILLGVTRTMVIRAARGRGVEVRYRALKLDQLSHLDEAFITSSSRGIVPVVQIDNVRVGQGRVGEVARRLMTVYEEDVLKHAEMI